MLDVPNISLAIHAPASEFVCEAKPICFETMGGQVCMVRAEGAKTCPTLSEFFRWKKFTCRKTYWRAQSHTNERVNPILSPRFRLMSVRKWPGTCLRLWCSPRYQRISPLHREFLSPLHPSSPAVSRAAPPLSSEI